MKGSRQVQRRIAREKANQSNTPFEGFDPYLGNRRVRRAANVMVRDVRNTRKTTSGRRVYYQYIYEIVDDKGKKMLSFGSTYQLPSNVIPRRILKKLREKYFDGKKLKWKREPVKSVFIKTIKHTTPSHNFIKIQKILVNKWLEQKKKAEEAAKAEKAKLEKERSK